MTDIDVLASTLLEESKRFLEKAEMSSSSEEARSAYLHAALNLAFCSLEAHVNSIAYDQLMRKDLSLHERAFLSEKKVELEAGNFKVMNSLQMYRLEDRLQYLWTRFSTEPEFDRKSIIWSHLKAGLELRNGLTHPKEMVGITLENVRRSLSAVIDTIDVAYRRIYKRPFPAKGKDLHSTLIF